MKVPATSFSIIPFCARPKRRDRIIPLTIRSLMLDRIEEAIEVGTIDPHPEYEMGSVEITMGELATLLQILFPEDWPELVEALKPTHTAPGSVDRIAAYTERAGMGEELYHESDADPCNGDYDGRLIAAGKLALAITQRANGSGPRVVGWAS